MSQTSSTKWEILNSLIRYQLPRQMKSNTHKTKKKKEKKRNESQGLKTIN